MKLFHLMISTRSYRIEQTMKKHSHWIAALAVVAAMITVVLTFVWFNIVTVTASMPTSERVYTLEALALQITILEMCLAVFAVVLAVLALFGYVGVRSAAEVKAQEVAENVANDRMASFIQQQALNTAGRADVPTVKRELPPTDDAKKVGGAE